MELTVQNVKGEAVGKVELDTEALLGPRVSSAVVHEVVRAVLANGRAGTAHTKTRAEVSGGGHKPWKQKHTGRARAGSNRSPLWIKGGIIFGPREQIYEQRVPLAKRRAALRAVLKSSLEKGGVQIVDRFQLSEPKTKFVVEALSKLGEKRPCVLVVSPWDGMLWRAARNVPYLEVRDVKNLNAYDCLLARQIIFTKGAFDALPARLGVAGLS